MAFGSEKFTTGSTGKTIFKKKIELMSDNLLVTKKKTIKMGSNRMHAKCGRLSNR